MTEVLHDTRTIRRAPPPPPLGAVIRVLNVPAEPVEYRLESGSCRIGAGDVAEITVSDETVSRVHAELSLASEGVILTDLGSRNGTFYLGQRVERITLALGSRFRIGTTEIAVEPDRQTLDRMQPADCVAYGQAIGVSEPMRKLFAVLLRLESSLVNVVLAGESGTGKELLAKAIHEHSQVASGPFIAVNCGLLDRSLARSELFGHKKGAFTTALDSHTGAFEAASGGTLFLDEIGELPLDVQPALLRALESGKIARIGEVQERPVKVRVIAATNRDLTAALRDKSFRADLYYRLSVVTVRVPPLRERPDDIDAIAHHVAAELGISPLAPDVLASFRRRDWPGNVRELRNALQAFAAVGTIDGSFARTDEMTALLGRWIDPTEEYAAQKQELLNLFQRVYISRLLEHTKGNQSEAARISGLQRSYLGQLARALTRDAAADPGSDPEE